MKKWIMSIFSTFFLLFILIFSVFIAGCATTPVTKFDSSQLTSDIDKIMGLGGSDCRNALQNKTIFINITVSQKEPCFLEDVDFEYYKIKKFEYEGDIGGDIEAKLKDALINDCGARIVDQIDQADISITSHIEKYYSQITKIDKVGSFMFASGSFICITPEETSVPCRVEASTILSIDNKINDENWKYNHLISLKHNRIRQVKHQGFFTVLSKMDKSTGMNFVVDYDNEYTVATAKFVSTSGINFVGGILVIPSLGKGKGSLDIYDIDTMQVKKHFAFEKGELSISEVGPRLSLTHMIVKDKGSLKCKYVELFLSTPGNLKYLIYDYIKELIRKMSKLKD